jgi:hypothetical protein
MAKMPSTPPGWNDDETSREAPRRDSDLGTRSGGLLDGWRSPAWSLENSGLGFLLHPDTIAQIDFGDKSDAPSIQAPASIAGKLAQERGRLVPQDLNINEHGAYQIAQAGGPLPFYMRARSSKWSRTRQPVYIRDA